MAQATSREQWDAHHAFHAGQDGTSQEIFGPVFDPFWKWERSASHSWRIERDILFALTRKNVAKEPDVVTALLQSALAVALRMRDEDEQFIDREMLRLERGEAYARWMLTGTANRNMLMRACQLTMQDAESSLLGDASDDDDDRVVGAFVAGGTFLEASTLRGAAQQLCLRRVTNDIVIDVLMGSANTSVNGPARCSAEDARLVPIPAIKAQL